MDITEFITNAKKDFTKQKISKIKEFMLNNENTVVISTLNKARGVVKRFYYIKDNKLVFNDYAVNNANVLIKALEKNGVKLVNKENI